MKTTSAHTKNVWASGDFTGDDRRPTTRVTIQKMTAPQIQYRYDDTRSVDWAHNGTFRSLLFGQPTQTPRELFNVRSVKWERGVESDVGTCTVVLGNVEARNSLDPASPYELDFPGFYTPNRGTEDYFDDWGYVSNGWKDWLIPDRIIRTYEGYGSNPDVSPEVDTNLYPSGVWLIDDVDIDTGGLITITARDIGRALMDQVMAFGLIPHDIYPLVFDVFEDRAKTQKAITANSGAPWTTPAYDTDSNRAYRTHPEFKDDGRPVVASDNTVYGHHPRDAFDPSTYTYWMSAGFRDKHASDAYVYLQGKMSTPTYVDGVQINAQHGSYTCYVSLQDSSGTWLGNKKVPYKAGQVDAGANIRYVTSFNVQKGETLAVKLPQRYANIKKIRYTFTTNYYGFGDKRIYHTAINNVAYSSNVTASTIPGAFAYGNYRDYTDIIKWLVCWGGWFWPSAASGLAVVPVTGGGTYPVTPASNDSVLVDGRAWGDFEQTGTNGLTKFDVDTWDNKPIMDGIGVIRDITGFDFWIDETGGVVWRLPNIWTKGNYLMPTKGGPRASRTTNLVTIDERIHLINMSVKLSSRNMRERIYVANQASNVGAVVKGYRPANTGLVRLAGWTDQHFKSTDECERMADLIALKQSFTYRQNQLTITANPAIQPDDQIIIKERMTGEGYIHRVLSVSSDFDNDTGRWTYTLTTNWLGNQAFTELAWDPALLTNATRTYLAAMGHLTG